MIAADVLIETILEGYIELDLDLRITRMNAAAERLMRVSRGEVLGKRLNEAVPEIERTEQWSAFHEALKQARRTDVSIFYPTQYVWHDIRVVPSGQAIGLLVRDVTDRQWLIRREAERMYLRNVLEEAPVAILLFRGPKHVIEYVNRFGRQISGGRDLEGKTVREAYADLEQKELFALLDEVYQKGTSFDAREMLIRFDRDGDGLLEGSYFDVSYQPARDFDGKVSGVLSISVELRSPAASGEGAESGRDATNI